MDLTYVNGVIAVREKYLINDRIFKLCESDAEEALRVLSESGFGKGTEISSVHEYEKLVSQDEENIDAFIREYAPSSAETEYFLAPRDFHNAKAVVKAHCSGAELEKMLAPEGNIPVSAILVAVSERKYETLGKILGKAVEDSVNLFADGNSAGGAEVGAIFEKALFSHLVAQCSKNKTLKKLITAKADMQNILTAMRSDSKEFAKSLYVEGGKLSEKQLEAIFSEDRDKRENALSGTVYESFYKKCLSDKNEGLALLQAEKVFKSYESDYLSVKKYELKGSQPFLYYVFRRRIENSNARILFVCLLAGMKEGEIRRRLRQI